METITYMGNEIWRNEPEKTDWMKYVIYAVVGAFAVYFIGHIIQVGNLIQTV
jgi:hypothetical protein